MGSSRKPKSAGRKGSRTGEPLPTRETQAKTASRAPARVQEIPPGVLEEIETQRGVLVTVITLLHCLHVVLGQQEDCVGEELHPHIEAAVSCASLPEMTKILLERTHAVLSALDSVNLSNALRAFKP